MRKKESFTGGFKKLKQDLSHMTLKQKWDHLWTYYRVWVVIALAIVMFISLVVTSTLNRHTRTTVAGVTINVSISEEGHKYLTDDLFEQLKTGGREKVYLQSVQLEDFEHATDLNINYYTLSNLITLIADKELDYVIMDEVGLRGLFAQDPFLDLREVLPQETLDALDKDLVRVAVGENAEEVPALINITDLPFTKANAKGKAPLYFAIIKNTPRLDACVAAWEAISTWQPTPAE